MENHGIDLLQIVAVLAAGILAVPLFKRLKLGAVLGYFVGGIAIGPFGLRLFQEPAEAMHVAEFGVIMLLFIIGLEMEPSRLARLKKLIFGLGLTQVLSCGVLLTMAGWLVGLALPVAFIVAMGFVLSSTALITQMLEERGLLTEPPGQRALATLLLEDLSIVPLLAVIGVLGSSGEDASAARWQSVAIAIAAMASLVVLGRWGLNPMFRLLARSNARAEMTAAALLVVLGSAWLMQLGGLSMALGAFLAGVLLSESSFRHQLEADLEPFRGILLGLFFIAVGMSLDFNIVVEHWRTILIAMVGFIGLKSVGVYAVARLFGTAHYRALRRMALFAQGGEFAFVLYSAALAAGILTPTEHSIFSAAIMLSMAMTPVFALLAWRLPIPQDSLEGVEMAEGLSGNVLLIGFGRFAQVVCQSLLARNFHVSIIETDVEMIKRASEFGFKVYYGDGTRLNTLRASGAGQACAILVCVDDRKAADRIVDLAKAEFPEAKLFVRAFDRGHAMDLIRTGVDYQIRETFESAMVFGEQILRSLGVPDDEAADIAADVRRRDAERLELQVAGDLTSGRYLIRGNAPIPAPLIKPAQLGEVIDAENAAAPLVTP